MAEFRTMAEAVAYVLRTGEAASFTEAHIPDAEFIAEVERQRRERIAAHANAEDVWLD